MLKFTEYSFIQRRPVFCVGERILYKCIEVENYLRCVLALTLQLIWVITQVSLVSDEDGISQSMIRSDEPSSLQSHTKVLTCL